MGRLGPSPSSARDYGWCPGEQHTGLTFCQTSRVCDGTFIGILLAITRRPPAPVLSCPCPSSRMRSKGYDRGKTLQHRLDDARSQPRNSISHIGSQFYRSRSFVVGESSRNAFCQYARTDGPPAAPGHLGTSPHAGSCKSSLGTRQTSQLTSPSILVTGPWAMPRPAAIEGQLWTCSMARPRRLT